MTLRIDRCGWTTVQDLGRPGFAHLGVPHSGAADRASFLLANRLVGNHPNAAMFETLGGLRITALHDTIAVITGAECEATVDGQPVRRCTSFPLGSGSTLVVDQPLVGARIYVAVSGGIIGTPLLGSLSHDTLSGIVPLRVVDGEHAEIGDERGAATSLDIPLSPNIHQPVRVMSGVHHEMFTRDDVARFMQGRWRVSTTSNRVGVRLSGVTLNSVNSGEHESFPLVLGAIQVTPGDEVVIMLADHPTTGGYPVIGVVHPDDVDRVAQLAAGSEVRFA